MTIQLDPTSIDLLLSIADLGSISKAAKRHGLTQPSASRRIRDLERRLGVRLLERSATGARLTQGAGGLTEHCRALVAAGDRLAEAAADLRSDERRSVSIAVSPPSLGRDLSVIASVVADDLPEMELNVARAETIVGASGVRDGQFDLAIVDGPSLPIGLSGHDLVERPLAVVVGSRHPWAGRQEPVSVDELASSPIWLPPPGTGTRDVIETAMNQAGSSTALQPSGVGGQHVRLAQAQLGRYPAIVRRECSDSTEWSRAGLHVVPTLVRLIQPIRMVWKGRQPRSAAAFDLWRRLRTVSPDFGN